MFDIRCHLSQNNARLGQFGPTTRIGIPISYKSREPGMSNTSGRLIAAAIAMVAGAIACSTEYLNINVGIAILVVASALFVAEYFRAQKS